MNAGLTSNLDRVSVGLVRRVTVVSSVLWAASMLAAVFSSRPLAFGILLGGGVMLALLQLYRWIAQGLLRPGGAVWYRPLFWLVWFVKWPVIGVLFFLALRGGLASAAGLITGVSVVPAAAVLVVLWALLADRRLRRPDAGGEA